MFRLFSIIPLAAAIAIAAACPLDLPADEPQRVSSWLDAGLKVRFPSKLAGMGITARQTYGRGDADYSINYRPDPDSEDEQAVPGESLDIYLYTRDDREATPASTFAEVGDALAAIVQNMGRNGMAEVFVNTNLLLRTWGETGLTNAVGLCELSGGRIGSRYASVVSVAAVSGRFMKLRYSLPVSGGDDVPARRFGEICAALDSLLADASRRANLDVYSAESPEAVRAMVRAKWPEAGDRVSQWLMPGWAERVERLNAAQHWCAEDYTNRIEQFERVSRDGVETRTDPELWYYNLACALSVQGRAEEAFEALEQSVAAGFADVEHALEDSDLANIRGDARFAKLMDAARVSAREAPEFGVEPLRPHGGECLVGEENVVYDFGERSYKSAIETSERRPVVYVNKNARHNVVPCEGLTVPVFDEEAYDAGAFLDTADICFALRAGRNGEPLWCPTIVACAEAGEGAAGSIPMQLALSGWSANCELRHELWNVLGVYAAHGFGRDGTDAFSCWCPGFIAHTGGADEGDKFVKLAADIIRALPDGVLESGFPVPQIVQKAIRSSQRGVSGEEGYMSGLAMRPVLDFADVDAERAIAAARALDPAKLQPLAPYFTTVETAFRATLVGDVDAGVPEVVSAHHAGFVATWAEQTGVIDVKLALEEKDSGIEWRVLSGDASRVRFEPLDGGTRIYVGYHEPFYEELPSGRKLRSARVDMACFAVRGGVASAPCVLSVYFPPTERREYTADGRLRSVECSGDSRGLMPGAGPRGEWRDEPHYDGNGAMTGWTRYTESRYGGVVAEEYTADGLVVMTRDEMRRPKRCRRDINWIMRRITPDDLGGTSLSEAYEKMKSGYDSLTAQPCGKDATTLVWEYEYGEDGRGAAHPVAPVPFRSRPELCPAADFGGESGIGLPLIAQMRIGYGVYSEYRAGRTPAEPAKPVRLRFAKRPDPGKSQWPNDAEEFEAAAAKRMYELGDGVYRATAEDGAQDGSSSFYAVDWTYMTMNRASEYVAFSSMGQRYARCDEDEVLAVLSGRTNALDVAKVHVNAGPRPLSAEELPRGRSLSCAMWRINDDLRFGVLADFGDSLERRRFFFAVVGGDEGGALTWDEFEEFPSQAIGDTVLAAARHEPDAVNNMAVLMHAGICNPDRPSQASVEKLLAFAAKGGCAAAAKNLRALHGGRERATKPPPPPELVGSMMGEYTPVCDIWDARWRAPYRERTPSRHVYCWNGAESTVCITATVEAPEGELKWKILQGDPDKIRLVPLGSGTGSVRAEIDWHGVYRAKGRDGRMRRTTRVEFGCVAVMDGLESEPCVVSVSASPHATREYDEGGWLRRINYAKPLLPDKLSSRFPVGDWEDVFEHTPDGRLSGWTRIRVGEGGAREEEHFTRDGLKVLTYDAIGRPLLCERNYRATLYQRTARGERADSRDFEPQQYEYRYTGPEDFLGRARPCGSADRR